MAAAHFRRQMLFCFVTEQFILNFDLIHFCMRPRRKDKSAVDKGRALLATVGITASIRDFFFRG